MLPNYWKGRSFVGCHGKSPWQAAPSTNELLGNGCGLGTLGLQRWDVCGSTDSFTAMGSLRQHLVGPACVTALKVFTAVGQHLEGYDINGG